jgi:hypothetical protein
MAWCQLGFSENYDHAVHESEIEDAIGGKSASEFYIDDMDPQRTR